MRKDFLKTDWSDEEKVSAQSHFLSNMLVVKLNNGGLVLYAPVKMHKDDAPHLIGEGRHKKFHECITINLIPFQLIGLKALGLSSGWCVHRKRTPCLWEMPYLHFQTQKLSVQSLLRKNSNMRKCSKRSKKLVTKTICDM